MFHGGPAGNTHALSYEELRQRYAHVPPTALQAALSSLVGQARQKGTTPGTRGLSSLLDISAGINFGGHHLPVQPVRRPPRWTLPPASLRAGGQGLPSPQLLLLSEAGAARTEQGVALGSAGYARRLQHHRTVRGHRFVAYCLAIDKTGRYIVTGSDDRLVKVCIVCSHILLFNLVK